MNTKYKRAVVAVLFMILGGGLIIYISLKLAAAADIPNAKQVNRPSDLEVAEFVDDDVRYRTMTWSNRWMRCTSIATPRNPAIQPTLSCVSN